MSRESNLSHLTLLKSRHESLKLREKRVQGQPIKNLHENESSATRVTQEPQFGSNEYSSRIGRLADVLLPVFASSGALNSLNSQQHDASLPSEHRMTSQPPMSQNPQGSRQRQRLIGTIFRSLFGQQQGIAERQPVQGTQQDVRERLGQREVAELPIDLQDAQTKRDERFRRMQRMGVNIGDDRL